MVAISCMGYNLVTYLVSDCPHVTGRLPFELAPDPLSQP